MDDAIIGIELRGDDGLVHIHWRMRNFAVTYTYDNTACRHEKMFRPNLLGRVAAVELPWPMPTCLACVDLLLTR